MQSRSNKMESDRIFRVEYCSIKAGVKRSTPDRAYLWVYTYTREAVRDSRLGRAEERRLTVPKIRILPTGGVRNRGTVTNQACRLGNVVDRKEILLWSTAKTMERFTQSKSKC